MAANRRVRAGIVIAGCICTALVLLAQTSAQKEKVVTAHARGTFDVKMTPQPADDKSEGAIGRFTIDKQFHGDLEGTSKGEMLGAGSPTTGSAGYVATSAQRHHAQRHAATDCHCGARVRHRPTRRSGRYDDHQDHRRKTFLRVRVHAAGKSLASGLRGKTQIEQSGLRITAYCLGTQPTLRSSWAGRAPGKVPSSRPAGPKSARCLPGPLSRH